MDSIVPCPQCQRPLRISEQHRGRKLKCPACGRIIASGHPKTPSDRAASERRPATGARAGQAGGEPKIGSRALDSRPVKFQVRVKLDPERTLKGGYLAELGQRGFVLNRGKKQILQIPLPTSAHYLGGSQFWVTIGGRDVTLALASVNLYRERFARAVTEALSGRANDLRMADYSIPRFARLISYSPALGLLPLLPLGGALGGALFGGVAGGFFLGNLAIFRQERWPLAVRTGAALGLSLVCNALFVALFVAIVKTMPAKPDGTPPRGPGVEQTATATIPSTSLPAAWVTPRQLVSSRQRRPGWSGPIRGRSSLPSHPAQAPRVHRHSRAPSRIPSRSGAWERPKTRTGTASSTCTRTAR
jgi:hypothetical protein